MVRGVTTVPVLDQPVSNKLHRNIDLERYGLYKSYFVASQCSFWRHEEGMLSVEIMTALVSFYKVDISSS